MQYLCYSVILKLNFSILMYGKMLLVLSKLLNEYVNVYYRIVIYLDRVSWFERWVAHLCTHYALYYAHLMNNKLCIYIGVLVPEYECAVTNGAQTRDCAYLQWVFQRSTEHLMWQAAARWTRRCDSVIFVSCHGDVFHVIVFRKTRHVTRTHICTQWFFDSSVDRDDELRCPLCGYRV